MIVGLFLRNFKCYGNLNFIPLSESLEENLNIFIGENGIGKSSILESLDCIMNHISPKSWEITLGQKRDRAFIGPVFLIKKSEFTTKNEPELEVISNYFWTSDFSGTSSNQSTGDFIEFRNKLKLVVDIEKYYFFSIGKDGENHILLTTSFHKKIFDSTRKHGVSKSKISSIFTEVTSYYSYIYIPIENKISDILTLESQEFQGLLDKSVVDEIKSLLDKKSYDVAGKKKSIVDLINTNLNDYVGDINKSISSGYKFNPKNNGRKNVSASDVVQSVFNVYFQVRSLKKDNKQIESLSSGQQRLALIDVASSLLLNGREKSKKVILAIDEPESSLQSSLMFEQFNRLISIAERTSHQILLTTHWYGLLLKPSDGRLNFIYNQDMVTKRKSFSMRNLFDYRRYFPNSIEMKSYFDLMTSMLSILKSSQVNWLICEGYDDAAYLRSLLGGAVERNNINILPFNGCGNVKKLYEFLSVPFSDDYENKNLTGKVFCLIDSDQKNIMHLPGHSSKKFKSKLEFKRFSYDVSIDSVELVSVSSTNAMNTEIEDVLIAEDVWSSLLLLAEEDTELKAYLENYSCGSSVVFSDLTNGIKFLNRETKEAYEKFEAFKDYIHGDSFKRKLVDSYCKNISATPMWAVEIVSFFAGTNKKKQIIKPEVRDLIATNIVIDAK